MKSQKAPSKYQKPLWDLRSLPETSKTSWNLRFHFRILEGHSELSYNPHVFRRLLLDLRNLSEISDWSKVPIEIAETSARDLRNVLDISEHCLRSQIDPLRYQKAHWYIRLIPEISEGSSEIAGIKPKWDRKHYPEISEPIRSLKTPQSSQNPL